MRRIITRHNTNVWEKEWNRLLSAEQRFLNKNKERKSLGINDKIEKVMPDTMQDTLDKAFIKGFEVVFDKGSPIVEKTFNKKKAQDNYKVNHYALGLSHNPETVRKFRKEAAKKKNVNMAISAVEGGAFGIFGVGVPDIPIFTGVIMRSLYELAINYGFSYESEEEQIFMLKVIENALSTGMELRKKDIRLNRWIDGETSFDITKKEQIYATAKVLSNELLYMKFVQTLPVVGIVGGAVDVWCLEQITSYAQLKYQRRFLQEHKKNTK